MPRPAAGFTLIELLVVIAVIGILAAALLPSVRGVGAAAEAAADAMQLRTHSVWHGLYRRQHDGAQPSRGGHQFVLATWSVVDSTPENLAYYFSPGARDDDPHYQELRAAMLRGERIWQDLGRCTPADTTYCGRAVEHLASVRRSDDEALMANANDGMSTLRDGTVNILLSSGAVRSLGHGTLREQFGAAALQVGPPVRTYGRESPIPACQKLAR